jgi:hypothetical protein
MGATEQFHVVEESPSYWRVTFDNGPVNLLDPDSVGQIEPDLGTAIGSLRASREFAP